MRDPRVEKLAQTLVRYSCKVKPREKVWIDLSDTGPEIGEALAQEVFLSGGLPIIRLQDTRILRRLQMGYTEEHLSFLGREDAGLMAQCACYIGVRGGFNAFENADVPEEQKRLYSRTYARMVHAEIRVPQTRWVVLRYPTPGMAQMAKMSTAAFEDYFFEVCTMNYARMSKAMDALVALMDKTDRVRLTGQGTDLRFSIRGIPAIKCAGELNIPDGEVFTAPVRDSVEGTIVFNTPSLYQGVTHEGITFTFEKGRIVQATGSDTKLLNQILDSDEGARYIGEFAIGVNPYITTPMQDTLFDEKIAGSFHFTPGRCYAEAPNGNDSVIHWDLVMIQTPEYGGGEMYFDDVLIRRDGLFVLEELKPLNPENLKG
ncbi:MAG: aminopeptidase [Christensenellales bacterium]|jgi:aminopeptidase